MFITVTALLFYITLKWETIKTQNRNTKLTKHTWTWRLNPQFWSFKGNITNAQYKENMGIFSVQTIIYGACNLAIIFWIQHPLSSTDWLYKLLPQREQGWEKPVITMFLCCTCRPIWLTWQNIVLSKEQTFRLCRWQMESRCKYRLAEMGPKSTRTRTTRTHDYFLEYSVLVLQYFLWNAISTRTSAQVLWRYS